MNAMMKQHPRPMEWAEEFGAIGDHSSLVRSASIRLPFFSTAIRHTCGLSALIPCFLDARRKRLRMDAVGFEVGPAHGGSVFVGRSSCTM
jgi:hypothetical protein